MSQLPPPLPQVKRPGGIGRRGNGLLYYSNVLQFATAALMPLLVTPRLMAVMVEIGAKLPPSTALTVQWSRALVPVSVVLLVALIVKEYAVRQPGVKLTINLVGFVISSLLVLAAVSPLLLAIEALYNMLERV